MSSLDSQPWRPHIDFEALRRSADHIIDLVAMMGRDSKMPCFAVGAHYAVNTLRQRFQLHLSADEAEQFVETDLVGKSFGSYYTRLYAPTPFPPHHTAANNHPTVTTLFSTGLKVYTRRPPPGPREMGTLAGISDHATSIWGGISGVMTKQRAKSRASFMSIGAITIHCITITGP